MDFVAIGVPAIVNDAIFQIFQISRRLLHNVNILQRNRERRFAEHV